MRRSHSAGAIAAALLSVVPALGLAATPLIPHVSQLGNDDGQLKPDLYRAHDRAYPAETIQPAQTRAAIAAWGTLSLDIASDARPWSLATPSVNAVDALTTYTGRQTTASGRTTALALTPDCNQSHCFALLGAAGGGIWRLEDPFGSPGAWQNSSSGLPTMAIGSIAFDPRSHGSVVYVGTGEQNQSGDSEAGLGLFRSTDGGRHWSVVPASVPLAEGLSISSIVIDPRDSNHLYFATALAGVGSAAVAYGSLPPHTAPTGIYESNDGGATFHRIGPTSSALSVVGVSQIGLDPVDPDTLYAAVFGVGLQRASKALDGDLTFRTVFATGAPSDGYNRLTFATNVLGKTTRIYLADTVDALGTSALYRVDNARVAAGKLNAGANEGWLALSSSKNGDPGFASYGFCEGQCYYDIFVVSPAGQPDTVWIGGSMNYDEIFPGPVPKRSNGRAVMRSLDGGVHFTDVTNDSRSPSLGMHPDQHVLVLAPFDPNRAIVGSDGGVVRLDGKYVDASSTCAGRGLAPVDFAECQAWLSSVPNRIDPINTGLTTLQFQSVTINPLDPRNSFQGGTQDNGTWEANARLGKWFESIGGDGGQSGFDAINPATRFHTYYGATIDVNFNGSDPLGWNYVSDPLNAANEAGQFYIPAIADPAVAGTIFVGLEHVWRTQDDGGDRAYLTQHCNEYTGDFQAPCGDWVALGGPKLTSTDYGNDQRAGGDIVAIARSPCDVSTLWTATTRGRLFISRNANVADPAQVAFERVDNKQLPRRQVSDIVVDPTDPNHAWIAYTGYGVNTPIATGHIFEVRSVPGQGLKSVVDISANIGDMPITALVRDPDTGTLYAATDFGVIKRGALGTRWKVAGLGLPPAAVYHLALSPAGRVLYAATHGRSVWTLDLP